MGTDLIDLLCQIHAWYYRTGTKFCRTTNFCRGLPELKFVIFLSTLSIVIFNHLSQPARNSNFAVQLAVQLVLFRQLAIALQLFSHFIRLSHHSGIT